MTNLVKALIVDDDPSWRELICDLFVDMEIELLTAADSYSAFELITNNKLAFAVLDLSLSSMDHSNIEGLDVLAFLRVNQPSCESVMLTGFSTVDIAVTAILKYGAKNFFRKEALEAGELMAFGRSAIASMLTSLTPIESRSNHTDPVVIQPSNQLTALIIEDDPAWVSFHQEWIEDLDIKSETARTVLEATEKADSGKFVFAVLDLTLDQGFVLEKKSEKLLQVLRQKDMPLILITGLADLGKIDSLYADQNIFACYNKSSIDLRELTRAAKLILADSVDGTSVGLTNRESEVMKLLAAGLTNKVIADKLYITPNTVKRHLKSIFHKLDVNTRSGAVAKFLENNPH